MSSGNEAVTAVFVDPFVDAFDALVVQLSLRWRISSAAIPRASREELVWSHRCHRWGPILTIFDSRSIDKKTQIYIGEPSVLKAFDPSSYVCRTKYGTLSVSMYIR